MSNSSKRAKQIKLKSTHNPSQRQAYKHERNTPKTHTKHTQPKARKQTPNIHVDGVLRPHHKHFGRKAGVAAMLPRQWDAHAVGRPKFRRHSCWALPARAVLSCPPDQHPWLDQRQQMTVHEEAAKHLAGLAGTMHKIARGDL